ncbi:hypothetical protein PIB30_012856 [Stylosanthes scabra]|uniref:Uncharacterized protein n=1 Tax=Stylosanthes scabra TaxID=79078 RepID=A0ABU6V5C3_9FABA|nr:hypothetical protein [Stylosanthes scabra]
MNYMENKKRRKGSDDEEEEEEEEKKMDKFYSLLRSFKEARDRRQKQLTQNLMNTNMQNTTNIWVPSFQEGDFTSLPLPPPSSSSSSTTTTSLSPIIPNPCQQNKVNNKDQHQHHHHHDAIDLNLSL